MDEVLEKILSRPLGSIINEHFVPTGSHTRCPDCLSVEGLHATLAGEDQWIYRCFGCGSCGTARLKTPEEKGHWVDGLG